MRASSRRKRNPGGIDLSPMLDVIFQLILFFLVSTTLAVLPGITVSLPESTTAQGTDAGGITLTVEKDGRIWLNGEETSMDSLDAALSSVDVGAREKESYPVTIAADSEVTNGVIVRIFDALRRNGFSAVSLRTAGQT